MHLYTYLSLFEFYLLSYSSLGGSATVKKTSEDHSNECARTEQMIHNCGFPKNISLFTTGQICSFKVEIGRKADLICNDGSWSEKLSELAPYRDKRQAGEFIFGGMNAGAMLGGAIGGPVGAGIGGAVGFLVGGIMCMITCKGQDPPPPHKPPEIDCGKIMIDKSMVAPPGQTTSTITLKNYKDKSGKFSVTSIPSSPVILDRGHNLIIFKVKDDLGYESSCEKIIELKVLTCNQPEWPEHGYVHCNQSEILSGDICTVSCQDGYEIKPKSASTLKCTGKIFDKDVPKCEMIHCSNSTQIQPAHGHPFCDDSKFPYGSVCVSECDKGYSTRSTMFSRCKQTKKWSAKLLDCEDNEPPHWKFCPSVIHVTADKNDDVATVTWSKPTAIDNSGQDPTYTQTEGKASGSAFDGFSKISYIATDGKGNRSPPCTFFIFVEKKFCNPPVFNGDQYLRYKCGKRGYQYGSECDILCQGSYPLVGNNKMICEMNSTTNELYWDWGDQGKPYCKQNKCPALTPPKNGALACDKWMYGTQCTLQCNEKYDIPVGIGSTSTFTGLFTCSTSSGKWNPQLTSIPECTVRRIGKNHRIPGELIYSGDCSDLKTQDQIKQNFVNHMHSLQNNPGYKGVCPSPDICNIENVEVICGAIRKRRRSVRNANDEITLTFEFVRKYEEFGSTTGSALQHAKQKFEILQNITQGMVDQGFMNVPNATIDTSSLQFGEVDIDCGPGRYPKYSTLTCGACALGSYLDKQSGKCISCKVGSYKSDEDALNCTQCPIGHSTESDGAIDVSNCLEICQSGYFSANGLAPCTPCPLGTYAQTSMLTKCNSCGLNQYTARTGSTNHADCAPFDISMEDSIIQIPFKPKTSSLQVLTLAGWIKFWDDSSSMEFSFEGLPKFKVQISTNMILTYGSGSFTINLNITRQSWNHISVVVSSTGDLIVYKNGAKIFSQRVTILNFSSHEMKIQAFKGVDVSSVALYPTPQEVNQVGQLSKSCVNNVVGAVVTFDDIRGKNITDKTVMFVTPSRCDALNECEMDPCHGHSCLDELNGFKCICSGGYTGPTCLTPPNFCVDNDCENGATCQNGKSNYTCVCPRRFKGTFCEVAPIDGGWSDWSTWMPCSVSCGGGQTTRFRNCTNPAPSDDGYPCSGPSTENKGCNLQICPTCPRRPYSYGTRMHCNTVNAKTSCIATCRAGLAFAPGHQPLKEYFCGRETNYTWNGNPPSCSKLSVPKSIAIHSSASFTKFPCEKEVAAKKEIQDNAMTGLQCGINKTCTVDVDIKGCGARQKRSTNVQVIVTLTIPLKSGDIQLDKLVENKTISPILANAIRAIADIEASAQEINRTGKVFQLVGMKLDVNNSKLQITNNINCYDGQIRAGTFCVDCPTGTFLSARQFCEPCSYGSYQDHTGQSKCKPCPGDFTTSIKGSQTVDMCFVPKPRKSSSENDGMSSTIVISITVALSLAVVFGIIALIFIRKYFRVQQRKREMGSNMSFNMVKPTRQDARKMTYFTQNY